MLEAKGIVVWSGPTVTREKAGATGKRLQVGNRCHFRASLLLCMLSLIIALKKSQFQTAQEVWLYNTSDGRQ